ncbi:MAG: nitronate monooxygenase [SAR324 cluster bacterium]|nr:nitronate monooxygenase [SAR324 cluster bacterium]
MAKLNDYRLKLGNDEYSPIMLGGMGMDISTTEMVLAAVKLGGIAHLSDALATFVSDKRFGTSFTKDRLHRFKDSVDNQDKSHEIFTEGEIRGSVMNVIKDAMDRKEGTGGIFVNCMEKLHMNNAKATLKIRLDAILDSGIDGITLSAGLHLGSLALIKDNPRFREAKIGIIVSSVRALKLFLIRAKKLDRLPDFIVVEGPLAGGHLGFKVDDWMNYDLKTITLEVMAFLKEGGNDIPVIPAGGIFTGRDAVDFMEMGAAAVQVATRFIITEEAGFRDTTKQVFFNAKEEDIEVNHLSPTGYPMRMLKGGPCTSTGIKPNCEYLGYILDNGSCSYLRAYHEQLATHTGPEKFKVEGVTCLCTYMKTYGTWTCGHLTYRLKDTTNILPDGSFQVLTVADVFNDYLNSETHEHIKPPLPKV